MLTYIIVDDEHLVREGTIKKISKLTLAVTCVGEASNGIEAIQLIQLKNPDIIITDMNMPVMNGMACFSAMQQINSEIAALFITGFMVDDFNKIAQMPGIKGYIQKPFTMQQLTDAIYLAAGNPDSR